MAVAQAARPATRRVMSVDSRVGKPADPWMLANIPRLMTAYYTGQPDPAVREQRVNLGRHRGSAFDGAFNEAPHPPHHLRHLPLPTARRDRRTSVFRNPHALRGELQGQRPSWPNPGGGVRAIIQKALRAQKAFRAGAAGRTLQTSRDCQDDKDQQEQADPVARIVSPSRAVGPSRKRANQHQDDEHDQNCRQHAVLPADRPRNPLRVNRARRRFPDCLPQW
jgi:hypothetical protein